jgi:deoxyribonuclease V
MAYFRPPGPAPDPVLVRSLTQQQHELYQRLRSEPLPHEPQFIAGCDSSFPTPDTILSVFVVLKYPSLELVEKVYNYGPVPLPYIPGLLSFREAPNVIQAFAKLKQHPDVIMVDGHGIAHPRRMGIAAHLGVTEPGPTKGDRSPLTDAKTGEVLGEVMRSKDKVLPLFVSAGHRCDLATATRLTYNCLRGYKLPEPTRLADHWAEEFKREVR